MTLYKYVPPERLDILTGGLIRFTQAAGLNDPFDLRPLFESFIPKEKLMAPWEGKTLDQLPYLLIDAQEAYAHLPPEAQQKVRFEELPAYISARLGTPEGREEIWELVLPLNEYAVDPPAAIKAELLKTVTQTGGIMSMSEVPDDLTMWVAYAESHRGVVICFNEAHPFFHQGRPSKPFLQVTKVEYRAKGTPYPSLIDMTATEIFFTKTDDWSYEKEWRMAAPLNIADAVVTGLHEPIYLFKFPNDCVEGVIVGSAALPELVKDLRKLKSESRYQHLSLRQARIAGQRAEFDVLK